MRFMEATMQIGKDGKLTIELPEDAPSGNYKVVFKARSFKRSFRQLRRSLLNHEKSTEAADSMELDGVLSTAPIDLQADSLSAKQSGAMPTEKQYY